MHYRLRDNLTGDILVPKGIGFKMTQNGTVSNHINGRDWQPVQEYTVEFAFEKDAQGNWLYEHCVMCK